MKLYSWGSNSHGQLGQGIQTEEIALPNEIKIDSEIKSITGGGKHTIILTTQNKILSCGDNDKGQLGKELSETKLFTFYPICCPVKIIKVKCGWDFNLALTENLEVLGWGSNSYGQLGMSVENVGYLVTPTQIFNSKAVEIGTGLRHSVIINSEGSVFSSGYGRKGQLGFTLNGITPNKVDKFTKVKGIKNCIDVCCGECHCIVKTESNEFYSWGSNHYGQLGLDVSVIKSSNIPLKLNLPAKNIQASQLLSGWAHNCILTKGGKLITWGRNDFGQLGEKRDVTWKLQFMKGIPEKIRQIALGSHHCIALTDIGTLFSWGWNEHGNCGNDSCINVMPPHKINGFKQVKLISSGAAHGFLCI